jgi:hypothetical protein
MRFVQKPDIAAYFVRLLGKFGENVRIDRRGDGDL